MICITLPLWLKAVMIGYGAYFVAAMIAGYIVIRRHMWLDRRSDD